MLYLLAIGSPEAQPRYRQPAAMQLQSKLIRPTELSESRRRPDFVLDGFAHNRRLSNRGYRRWAKGFGGWVIGEWDCFFGTLLTNVEDTAQTSAAVRAIARHRKNSELLYHKSKRDRIVRHRSYTDSRNPIPV